MNEFQKTLYERLQVEHQEDLKKAEEAGDNTIEAIVNALHARGMSEGMIALATGAYSRVQSQIRDQGS